MSGAEHPRPDAALDFQSCPACGNVWWFRREFCPRCGRRGPDDRSSTGRGSVEAVTVVHRAPDEAWRPHVPYTLVLVAMDDGFRAMGHGEPGLAIGDGVWARTEERAGRSVPVFARER